MIDETHDPRRTSWVSSAETPGSEFPIQNLPFASFRMRGSDQPRVGIAIGEQLLDATASLNIPTLMSLMEWNRPARAELRRRVSNLLSRYTANFDRFLVPQDQVEVILPCPIGDYTDFYASLHHATNVGSIFRPSNPLLPNYKWIPIAYHGRSSSIVCSGAPIYRPFGQLSEPGGPPHFAPSALLDYEVELGAFVGPGNPRGTSIPIDQAEDHLFGVCLLNDWSARDIQSWEYQPLGPFLAKSFATTISPWLVTLDALEPFRRTNPPRPDGDPQPLAYLRSAAPGAFSITLEAWLQTPSMTAPVLLSQSNFASLYWTLAQMVTHHASNGCPLRPGDLIGSGTVSGPEKRNRGCLLEHTWRGSEPLTLPNGESRAFLEDGDEVTLRGYCDAPGFRRIGLGICFGKVFPPH